MEKKLTIQGREKTLKQTNIILLGYLSRLGQTKLGSAQKPELILRLIRYMEDRNLWKHPKPNPPPSVRINSISSKEKSSLIAETDSRKSSTGKNEKKKSSSIAEADLRNKGKSSSIDEADVRKSSTGKNKRKSSTGKNEKKKSSLIAEADLRKSSEGKKKKKRVQKNVSSKNYKKQKKKHQIPWLRETQLILFEIGEDGNCLFRAMSHQLYGTQEYHQLIRKRCCDYIELEKNYYKEYIANKEGSATLTAYIRKMRKDGVWGGNIELMALTELYRKTIEVYHSGPQPDHVFGDEYNLDEKEEPIRLHFRGRNHYESLFSKRTSEYFVAQKAGFIEDNNLNQYRKIKLAKEKTNKENEEENIHNNIEELNLQEAIQESLKLQKIEQERADNRKKFEEELRRAIELSMKELPGTVVLGGTF